MFLSEILASKQVEVAAKESQLPLGVLKESVARAPGTRDFLSSLRQPGLGVIAEIKRRSPSKGPLRPDLDAPSLARRYEAGGCVAVSVLTDEPYFGARSSDLAQVRSAVSVPVLRKDFLISEYQIWESRAMGADAVLLIVAALDASILQGLIGLACELGLSSLVEVHTTAELEIALVSGARIVGINNRDLHSFHVELEVTRRLRPLIPPDVAVVSESGISDPTTASLVGEWGVDAILVGEGLVKSDNPTGMVQALSLDTREPS